MIHRALMGSIERFFGVLIEHYGGAFPLWLAPVQAVVIPLTEKETEYADAVAAALRAKGLRIEVNYDNERIGYKIRQATLEKIPYMAVVGPKEIAAGAVGVRERPGRDLGALPLAAFADRLAAEVAASA